MTEDEYGMAFARILNEMAKRGAHPSELGILDWDGSSWLWSGYTQPVEARESKEVQHGKAISAEVGRRTTPSRR